MTPPSGVPLMPSAVSKSAQTISHFAPAATMPGIAVMLVSRSPGSSACAPAESIQSAGSKTATAARSRASYFFSPFAWSGL